MIARPLVVLALGFAAFVISGCATTSAKLAGNADLTTLRRVYVIKLPADERGVNQVIADQLGLLGYEASTGAATTPPTPVDAIVTYQDKWMWDITMYLIELNVQIRSPQNRVVLATGRSYRPSLQRRSPSEMAKEVLQSIFNAESTSK